MQKIEEKISGIADTMPNSQRKYKKEKTPNSKHSRSQGHNEKTKPKDYRHRRVRMPNSKDQ